MIKSALKKDVLRDIKKSLGRFLSITAIIALGVAFFTGLKISPQVMKGTADNYYDNYNLMDIRIVSTLGLTDDDIEEINKIEGIEEVFGTYTMDVLAEYKEKEVVLRVHGLPNSHGINNVKLVEGRLPEGPQECVIEKGKNGFLIPIGSTISLQSGKDKALSDDLENTEFEVVGYIQTPYYLSSEKGSSNIGNGRIRSFIMIPQENFKMEVYTDIYTTVNGVKELNSYNEEYFQVVDKVTKQLKNLAKEREIIRYEEIVDAAKEELEKGKNEYYQEKEDADKKLADALIDIEKGKEKIAKGEKDLEIEERNFLKTIKEGKEKLDQAEADLIKGEEEYNLGLKSFEDNKKFIIDEVQLAKTEEELNKTNEILQSSREKLEEEKRNLIKGEKKGLAEIQKATEKLEKAKLDLQEGEKEYLESKAKAEKEFKEAWEKIEDGEREIEKIEKGKWYVLDRKSHYSYMDYGGAADRIDAISKVFPLFFALVAVLVCLTTMTRMVDEQRVSIGTLKALGYGKGAIGSKYIFYAFSATFLGCIIGVAIGYTVFPTIIFNAYGMMYLLPPVILKFNSLLALATSLVAIGLTTMTTYIACNNELKETAAALMRPKAPKAGKRILLERIPFIWNRFNFSGKVTIRNIFRYKRRFFMTVFGIAGCTALILTAFGVKDSIRTIVYTQFGELFTYDITIALDSNGIEHLKDDRILKFTLIHKESGKITADSISKDISIIVPKDIKEIDKFIHLRNRKNGNKLQIPQDGVIITEQVSRSLGIKVGDEIIFSNSEDNESIVKVKGIAENYLFNYVYITKDYYEEVFPNTTKFNEAIGVIQERTEEFQDKLSKDLIKKEGITNISFNTTTKEDFEDTIKSLNYVVFIMILSAGALAFVVLYNLTNVNISERIREIATIKVLGFYDMEVSSYIYRENTVLTVIGTMVGLVIGIFLHRYIMTTVEMDNLMFGLKLDIKSYIISVILTLGFAILVNLAMYYKLKNVEMVESLKSID